MRTPIPKYMSINLRIKRLEPYVFRRPTVCVIASPQATKQSLCVFVIFAFLINTFGPMPVAQAQDFRLPAPGVMVHLSPPLDPPILKGIKVHPENPFRFDFILDKGDSQLSNDALKDESSKLIKYFLASLTIPEKDLWVNLSPYEKDRIIPNSFGLTEMGRDLLGEDYMLKQITASLIYPEDQVGKRFWKRIYEEAQKRFGMTNIPVNTFNKVWIVPEKAVVYENAKAGTAYVVESKLKVMLEQDYLSLEKHTGIQSRQAQVKDTNQLGSQIVREIVIPELTTEVNENKNFAQLRQVYNSLILATWYKKKIKDSILEQVYADKKKVAGVNIDDPKEKERIYQRYLQAFKKGVYNYIKEDIDPITSETISKKYFSGGATFLETGKILLEVFSVSNAAILRNDHAMLIGADVIPYEHRDSVVYSEEQRNALTLGPFSWLELTDHIRITFVKERNDGFLKPMEKHTPQGKVYEFILPEDIKISEVLDLVSEIEKFEIDDRDFMNDEILSELKINFYSKQTSIETSQRRARMMLEAVTYFRGLRLLALDQKIKLDLDSTLRMSRQEIQAAKIKVFSPEEITRSEIKAIRAILKPISTLEGWKNYGPFKINDSAPAVIKLKNELNCVGRSALTALYLRQLGIEVHTVGVPGHVFLLASLSNGNFFVVEPSSKKTDKSYEATILELARIPNRTVSVKNIKNIETGKINKDRYDIAPWQNGLLFSFYSNIAPMLSSLEKYKESEETRSKSDELVGQSNRNSRLKFILSSKLSIIFLFSFFFGALISGIEFQQDRKDSDRPSTVVQNVDRAFNDVSELSEDQVLGDYKNLPEKSFQQIRNEFKEVRRLSVLGEYDKADELIQSIKKRIKSEGAELDTGRLDRITGDLTQLQIYQKFKGEPLLQDGFSGQIFLGRKAVNDGLLTKEQSIEFVKGHALEQENMDLDHFESLLENTLIQVSNGHPLTAVGEIFQARQQLRYVSPLLAEVMDGLIAAFLTGGAASFISLLVKEHRRILRIRVQKFLDKLLNKKINPKQKEILIDEIIALYYSGISKTSIKQNLIAIFNKYNIGLNEKEFKKLLKIYDRAKAAQKDNNVQPVKSSHIYTPLGSNEKGGIDLTPANMNLQTQNAGSEIKFHMDPAMLQRLQNAPGFVPVIISIWPLEDLHQFLGLATDPAPASLSMPKT